MTSAVHFVNTVLCVAKCVRRCRKSDGVLRPFRRRTTNAEPHPFALWRRIPWAAPSSPSPDRRSSRLLGDVAELRTGRDASDALMTRRHNPETRTSWWRLEREVDDSVYIKKPELVCHWWRHGNVTTPLTMTQSLQKEKQRFGEFRRNFFVNHSSAIKLWYKTNTKH